MKPALAAGIIRQLAAAVQCSHEHNILHRDIKPGNILLFPNASGASEEFPFVPRLGDFGLAKLMEASELDAMTSQLVGTPLYMAPELQNGLGQPAHAAADIYGLGSVLYCLIVGQPPFVAATTAETFRLIAECDPVPPDKINRGIGRDLSLICLKCLEKNAGQRYASAAQLGEDLDRFIAGKPVLARSKSIPVRVQKWCRQRPLVALLLMTSGTLVAALLCLALLYTESLRNLQGQLETMNRELLIRVQELANAAQVQDASTAAAIKQRQLAERLLFAADVQHASQILKKGDAREAIRILGTYAHAPDEIGGIYGPDNFAWRRLWNRATNPSREICNVNQSVWWMQPSPDGSQLAVCGSRGEVQFLNTKSGFAVEHTFTASTAEVDCVAYSDDGQLFATAGDDGKVRLWSPKTRESIREFEVLPGRRVFGIVFLPMSHQMLACGESTLLSLWDADTGRQLREITTPFERPIEFMRLSPDRKRLLMAGADGRLVQLNVDNFSILSQQKVSRQTLSMARYSSDGARIVCGGSEKVVRILDAETGDTELAAKSTDIIHTVLFTPDGQWVIASRHGTDDIEILSRDKMQSVALLPGHQSTINQVLFSCDGEYLISTSNDRMTFIWSCRTWQRLHQLSGHQSGVLAAAISADGQILATADEQGIIKLWDFVGGREFLEMDKPVSNLIGLTFSTDDQTLIAWDRALNITLILSPLVNPKSFNSP